MEPEAAGSMCASVIKWHDTTANALKFFALLYLARQISLENSFGMSSNVYSRSLTAFVRRICGNYKHTHVKYVPSLYLCKERSRLIYRD